LDRAATGGDSSAVRLLKLTGWSAIMAPIGIVLHELGHYLTARAFGFSAELKAASVSGGAQLGLDPDWMVAAQAAAGPVVTLIIILFAVFQLRRRPERLWTLALAATAPLRFLVGGSYLAWATYVWWVAGTMGDGNFDEANFAKAAGVALTPILATQLLLLFGLWAWLVATIRRGQRIVSILAILTGAFAGIGAWMTLGPRLFALT
jgi:hypothetical protein